MPDEDRISKFWAQRKKFIADTEKYVHDLDNDSLVEEVIYTANGTEDEGQFSEEGRIRFKFLLTELSERLVRSRFVSRSLDIGGLSSL